MLLIVGRLADDHRSLVPAATFFVAAGVVIAALLARAAKVSREPPVEKEYPARKTASREPGATQWVGALAGVVVVAGGLGLVRAAFPAFVLGIENTGHAWWVLVAIGIATALVGGWAVQWVTVRSVRRLSRHDATRGRRHRIGPALIATVPIGIAGVWMAVDPSKAAHIGTPRTLAVGFGVSALLIGLFNWLSRRYPPWAATHALGLGKRTPWLTLLAITWVVASALNTEGVYHDARVEAVLGPPKVRYASLDTAFGSWLAIQDSAPCVRRDGDSLPLVMVAAPGGGIRAAYWTASTLDALFGRQAGACAARDPPPSVACPAGAWGRRPGWRRCARGRRAGRW